MVDLVNLGIGIAAHKRIGAIRSDMRSQKRNLDESELTAISMRQDIEKLYLLVEALWAIVKTSTNLTDEGLSELVRQIDEQDGRQDGRNSSNAQVLKCDNCGKTLLRGQTRCAYCGSELREDGLFRHNGK